MKCALCGREIKGRDYIYLSTPDKKGIYVHSAPCEWYASEGNMNDDTVRVCKNQI
jgi:hypothetical protein